MQSYTDANQNVAAVVMTRPLPGLKPAEEAFVLPECDEEELLLIASKVAGRGVNRFEIPFREYQTRLPLFATIVGAYLRQSMPLRGRTPSQIVSEMVRRVLDDSLDDLGDTAEFLKELAIASTKSGENVEKALVAPRATEQARIANSRIVVEQDGKFDFTLAIFREWFAARALVERSVSIDEIELDSDRWVVPLAIAINSENSRIGPEIMDKIAARDPGVAGLVLNEVKHNWSTDKPENSLPPGTAIELGSSIRNAMENWREGLGPLMYALRMLDENGSIPTLGIDVRSGRVATSWYRGDEILDPVVQLPEDLHDQSKGHFWNWPSWTMRGIEPTRVWPWSITLENLSRLLSEELNTLRFALESSEGFHEFAHEFDSFLRRSYFGARDLRTSAEVIDYVENHLSKLGSDPRRSVTFGYREYSFTVPELQLFRKRVSELSSNGTDILTDPWPAPDKPWPEGRSSVTWSELYTDDRLLQRTNAIFNAALRIYKDIVEGWFPAFNKRTQMSHVLPFRMRGEIRLPGDQERGQWRDTTLIYWTEQADSEADSGVFIELEPKEQTTGDEFAEQRIPYHSGWRILPGHGPRPAAKLAHEWLTDDLQDLHWA